MEKDQVNILIFLLVVTVVIWILLALIIGLAYLYKHKSELYSRNLKFITLKHENDLVSAELEIREQAFKDISREIHDSINLTLTLSKLHLNTIEWARETETRNKVLLSTELLSEAIVKLQNISTSLNSDLIQTQGLLTAIDREMKKIEETGVFEVTLDVTGTPLFLEHKLETIIFRVIQECFNNVIKHAHATKAKLVIHYGKQNLNIKISDNGRGFPKGAKVTSKGAGLLNIRSRIKLLGGFMSISSIQEKATTLTFLIPYHFDSQRTNPN